MMDFIMVPLVVGIVFLGVYGLFELIVRRKERMAIIDKIGDKLDPSFLDGKLKLPGYGAPSFSFNALKMGCLLAGIGLGVLVGFIINVFIEANMSYLDWHRMTQLTGAAYGASVLLFGGVGLIIAFVIELKIKKN